MGKRINKTDRSNETFAETTERYLAQYGEAGLRAMATEARIYGATWTRMPIRYSVAARIVADMTVGLAAR